ncbi:hypothetical protein U1Q18_014021 [Sarracenia purpurea var. burkii]
MKINIKTFFFWFSALAIALFSILILSLHIPPSSSSQSSSSSFVSNDAIANDQTGVDSFFFSIIDRIAGKLLFGRHHHRRKHKNSCDDDGDSSKWKSSWLVNSDSGYNVSVVLTVDLKGCANFSSVQKAVDAAPDYSLSITLILIDSGTYRPSPGWVLGSGFYMGLRPFSGLGPGHGSQDLSPTPNRTQQARVRATPRLGRA